MKRPIEFTIALEDFDTARLPAGSRQPASAEFQAAVARFYESEFAQAGGTVAVHVGEADIHVRWLPEESGDLLKYAVQLLSAGDYPSGIPLLQNLSEADPKNEIVLFNLGMAESDVGRLDEARGHLERAVDIEPRYAAAWVALGVAQQRSGMPGEAIASFEAALEVDPQNAYAERNLAATLGSSGDHTGAEVHFRRSTMLTPHDQAGVFGLARAVESLGRFDEANELYLRSIQIDPDSQVAEVAKAARSAIASRGFRIESISQPRNDVVAHCLAAFEVFERLAAPEIVSIVAEIASLGQGGLDVNDSAPKYSLNSLAGRHFSGLQLVAMMYVGMKGIEPSTNVGFDLSKEYEQAREIHRARRS